jgi:hypothetical protein
VKEQVILVFNVFKGFIIILASYLLFSDFTGHCSLFIINSCKRAYLLSKNIAISCPKGRMERRDEGRN